MRYLGGKSVLSPVIARAISVAGRGRNTYLEPFVGGGSVLVRAAPLFEHVVAADIHVDLILMWQAVQRGWVPPVVITRADYEHQRHAPPSALRGYTGFAASFGSRWFSGYGTRKDGWDLIERSSRSLTEVAGRIKNVSFECADYRGYHPDANTVVYADPPYEGTVAYLGTPAFESGLFWNTMGDWVERGAVVLVSSYDAPRGWVAVRERHHHASVAKDGTGKDTTERLFRHLDERSTHACA